jgi:hypothetical protein
MPLALSLRRDKHSVNQGRRNGRRQHPESDQIADPWPYGRRAGGRVIAEPSASYPLVTSHSTGSLSQPYCS